MTKKEAIEILNKEILCVNRDCDTSRCKDCDLVMPDKEPILKALKMALNSLKVDQMYDLQMENADGWISVSERLPEVEKKILVTSYGRVCYAAMISTDGHNGYPIFRLQDSLKEKTVYETIVHNDMTSNRIIAWMPLPEPYKAD